MIRFWFGLFLVEAVTATAQVRSGGPYQITAETLDSGGGAVSGGLYGVRQALPALGTAASGGAYSLLLGYTAQLGGGAGSGTGSATFLLWQTVLFGGPAEPGAGPYDDTDRDGIPNLLEFAFNLSPFTAATPLASPGTFGGLPFIREEIFGADAYMTMEFIRRKNAGLYQPESSVNLANWTPVAFTILSGPDSVTTVYERVKLRVGPPILPTGRVFYRLAVNIQ